MKNASKEDAVLEHANTAASSGNVASTQVIGNKVKEDVDIRPRDANGKPIGYEPPPMPAEPKTGLLYDGTFEAGFAMVANAKNPQFKNMVIYSLQDIDKEELDLALEQCKKYNVTPEVRNLEASAKPPEGKGKRFSHFVVDQIVTQCIDDGIDLLQFPWSNDTFMSEASRFHSFMQVEVPTIIDKKLFADRNKKGNPQRYLRVDYPNFGRGLEDMNSKKKGLGLDKEFNKAQKAALEKLEQADKPKIEQ
jgi:hypothetical protein